MINETLHKKLKIEQHEPHKIRGELRCSRRVRHSCSTGSTSGATLIANLMNISMVTCNAVAKCKERCILTLYIIFRHMNCFISLFKLTCIFPIQVYY